MLSRRYPKQEEFCESARRHLKNLQHMKQADRWAPVNVLEQSDVQRYDQQDPMNISIVKRLDLLENIQNDHVHRKSYLDDKIASSMNHLQKKSSPILSKQRQKTKEQNELLRLKVAQMQNVIYRLMNQKSSHHLGSGDYRGKYKNQKQKVMILERQKHGMQVLLKLVREEYDEYRQTAEKMLADRHQVEGDLYQVQASIRQLSETVASKNNEIQLYKQENYIISREVQQLKNALRQRQHNNRQKQRNWQRQKQQSKQNSSIVNNDYLEQQLQQLGFQISNKDIQISQLKNNNNKTLQKLELAETQVDQLKRQIQQNIHLLKGSTVQQILQLNQKFQKRIIDLQQNIQHTHSSQRQSIRLHQEELEGIKENHNQQIDNLTTDLGLAKQQSANMTRLLDLQRDQNDQLRLKVIQYQNVIMDQVRREDMLNDLQRKLRQTTQKSEQKSRQIEILQNTIQKYLHDIRQMQEDHEQLQKSLELHRKIHEQYKQKYRLLEEAFNKKVEILQEKELTIQQQSFSNNEIDQITNIASKYGFESYNSSLAEWISEQLKDSNDLIQANTNLKRTLNALNRQIQDRWIKQKIQDLQQIQRLKDLLKPEQNEWKQSKMLDTIRQESKDDMLSFESFKHRLGFIKKKLQGLIDKSVVEQNLLESELFQQDSEEQLDKIIHQIKKHIDSLIYKSSSLATENQTTKQTFNTFQQTIDELKDQVSQLNQFLVQKEQYIQQLLKQKEKEKQPVKLLSFGDVPVQYSVQGDSKKSISFKLESHVFANMQSKHELRANIRQKMKNIIQQYFPIEQNTLSEAIQDLFVNIYQLIQSQDLIKYFEKFLQDVKLFTKMSQKQQSNIKQMVDELIRQSQSLIESDEQENDNEFY